MPVLEGLVARTGETAAFYVRRGEQRLCLFRADSPHLLRMHVRVGDALPLDNSAIAQVLRVQSKEIRTKRRQRAEEQAQKVAVKILIPLIFCILPCLFIAVLGPAGIRYFAS